MNENAAVWTIERLEAAIHGLSEAQLLARNRQCVEGGHVWRPLDATSLASVRRSGAGGA